MWYNRAKTRLQGPAETREASGLSRVHEHMTQNQFATISAHTEAGDTPEARARNKAKTDLLKRMLRARGYGFIPAIGGWRGDNTEGQYTQEESFIVPNMSDAAAKAFGRMFDQEAVLMGFGGQYSLTPTKIPGTDWANGDVGHDFHNVSEDETPEFFTQVGRESLKDGKMNRKTFEFQKRTE